jgi:hypothetical protein
VALVGADRDRLGIAAGFSHRQHPVADAQRRHAGSQRSDDPGRPLPRNEWPLREKLVDAADDQYVDVIDGRRVRLDEHLAGAWNRRRGLAHPQRLRRTEFIDDDRAH